MFAMQWFHLDGCQAFVTGAAADAGDSAGLAAAGAFGACLIAFRPAPARRHSALWSSVGGAGPPPMTTRAIGAAAGRDARAACRW